MRLLNNIYLREELIIIAIIIVIVKLFELDETKVVFYLSTNSKAK